MSNEELMALTALVNHQTVAMAGQNELRKMQGYSPAYVDPSPYWFTLENELIERGIFK